jgi:plastocyanin
VALSRSGAATLTVAVAVVACLLMAGSAFGASDHRVVKMQDRCDPATFDAAVGDGTCVRDGGTLFADFLEEFQDEGSVNGWSFSREETSLDAGGTIELRNDGGEFHTFTPVKDFGNGCIKPLLDNGEPDAVDCADFERLAGETGLPAGASVELSGFEPGSTVKFQCLIHPWMRSTVTIEGEDDDHSGRG